jgi:hypothetical protein
MKILSIYSYFPSFTLNHWLNVDWLRSFNKYPNIEMKMYGWRVDEGYPDISLCPYNPNMALKDLRGMFNFDIIICYTKSRMFESYLPAGYTYNKERKEQRGKCFLPQGFALWKNTPKIIMEEDTHYELNGDWYREQGFDLILSRHFSQSIRKDFGVKNIWLPFSVDTEVFKPNLNIERINKIAFCGSESEVYTYRNEVRRLFKNTAYLDDFKYSKKEKEYIECLQSYVGHLSCSSIYHITPAKMMEIRASGSLLFTDEGDDYGLEKLFPRNTYVTYNRDSTREDIKRKIKYILDNKEEVKKITTEALDDIKNNHTHQIRISQMLDIFKREL